LIKTPLEEIMTISTNTTVREVALELPYSASVFERLKIDYCCRGERLLGEACANAGVEVDSLMRMVEEAKPDEVNVPLDLQKSSLTELIMHILDNHHIYTKAEMARLEPLIEKVIAAHGENHPELRRIGRLFQKLSQDLKPHMFKEEQILFPYIVQLEKAVRKTGPAPFAPFGTVNNPVRMMMMEHETVGELLRDLRSASANYTVPPDGCLSYHSLYQGMEALEKDLHQHIHLENNLLFPRAVEMEGRL
jgi:regulator of cell morphogenesis and NO signaling